SETNGPAPSKRPGSAVLRGSSRPSCVGDGRRPSAASKEVLCAQFSLLLGISGRALAAIGRFAGSDAKSHRPTPRFRTIQVYPKDLRVLPVHPEPAVSWHSGFRGGAHARPKTTPVDHAARRRGSRVAARGACAAIRPDAPDRSADEQCGG